MKKQLAFGIAGAAAALVAGWQLVRQMADRDEVVMDPVAVAPGMPAEETEVAKVKADAGVDPRPSVGPPSSKSSKAELYEIAQDLDLDGRSKMTKSELLKAIEEAG